MSSDWYEDEMYDEFEYEDDNNELGDIQTDEETSTFDIDHGLPAILWVNAYSVSREYGGPEEGGWYYDWYTCLASMPVGYYSRVEEDETQEVITIKKMLTEHIGWEKSNPQGRYSVIGGEDFVVLVETRRAGSVLEHSPHYE